ncbi:bifunctional Eukaryotic Ribosomal Protein L27 [Babesia duncani]|uniref:Bifunctional Eukaryotic Ribosomal Protein L27 n=1 Tax=Babesia duncani TaxID=323732 RepID=A0AAD9PI63_9APIC|nr:bifunctional Eukaryotic Ribosomal Protein L27 [Babesia duncani]
MAKILRPGRVVIILSGRRAGKKAVIVQVNENSTKEKPYAHCLVAGIEKPPMKVTKKMPKKKIEKRLKIKTFVKFININHVMPTRYVVTNCIDPKALVTEEQMQDQASRKAARKAIKGIFEEWFVYSEFQTKCSFSKPELVDASAKGNRDAVFLKKRLRF